jgi:RNA polymerase sigma factor (sigma-70 family)
MVPHLQRAAMRYLRNKDAANDLIQDLAVLVLHEHHNAGFQTYEHMKAWTLTTLRWRALDEIRRTKRHQKLQAQYARELQPKAEAAGAEDERLGDVLDAARSLPERQREVFYSMLNGLDTTDIAERMQIKESSVRSLWRFARTAITKQLGNVDNVEIEGE